MTQSSNLFLYSPGSENEGSTFTSNNKGDKEKDKEHLLDVQEEITEKKPLSEKLREALQDWSNDDQKDQEIDDSTP
jgi:hypothetical protein